jgi:hypothetical protein
MPSCSRQGGPPTLDKLPSSGAGSDHPRQEKSPGPLGTPGPMWARRLSTIARCTSGRCSQLSSSARTCMLQVQQHTSTTCKGQQVAASGIRLEQLDMLPYRRGFGLIDRLPTAFQLPARNCQLPHQEHRPTSSPLSGLCGEPPSLRWIVCLVQDAPSQQQDGVLQGPNPPRGSGVKSMSEVPVHHRNCEHWPARQCRVRAQALAEGLENTGRRRNGEQLRSKCCASSTRRPADEISRSIWRVNLVVLPSSRRLLPSVTDSDRTAVGLLCRDGIIRFPVPDIPPTGSSMQSLAGEQTTLRTMGRRR